MSNQKSKNIFKSIAKHLHLGINRAIHRNEIYDEYLHKKIYKNK